MTIKEQFIDEGVRYLRGQDLIKFFVSDSNPVYIPYEAYTSLRRSHMKKGDVLLSIVGTIGSVSLVTDKYDYLTGSCKIAIIRSNTINPYFLAAYLASNIGQAQIKRRVRGAVQQGLILPDLRYFPIPVISEQSILEIEDLIKKSQQLGEHSVSLYAEAEALLTHELGLDRLDLSPQLTYTGSFSLASSAARLDAEFFQPKYKRLIDSLKTLNPISIVPLDSLLSVVTNGHTPLHHDLAVGDIPFLTAEHIQDFRIDFNSQKRILTEHHEGELKRTQLRVRDVLITIKGRIGNAAIVDNLPSPANINQDVALLRFLPTYHPYFIVGYLNSILGKTLIDQICTGQINPFLGLGNLRQLQIPIFDEHLMNSIGQQIEQTVQSADQAHQDAARLLETAKQRVEQMILGSA
ncbi:MAG: hypothetical protein ABI947_20650 [Chloroflexota bacterium]